jgi:hypothetical protein
MRLYSPLHGSWTGHRAGQDVRSLLNSGIVALLSGTKQGSMQVQLLCASVLRVKTSVKPIDSQTTCFQLYANADNFAETAILEVGRKSKSSGGE